VTRVPGIPVTASTHLGEREAAGIAVPVRYASWEASSLRNAAITL
jgi:hypothetical protein